MMNRCSPQFALGAFLPTLTGRAYSTPTLAGAEEPFLHS